MESSKAQFIYIDPSLQNHEELLTQFKTNVRSGKHVFLFVFMEGCPPCKATKPEWDDIKTKLADEHLQNNDIIIAEINQLLFKNLDKVVGDESMGYPCLRYIKDNNVEEYENPPNVSSFVEWIDKKLKDTKYKKHKNIRKHQSQNGGSKRKTKKSKKSKKSKKRKSTFKKG